MSRPRASTLLLGVPVLAAGALVGLCLSGPTVPRASDAGLHLGGPGTTPTRSVAPALSAPGRPSVGAPGGSRADDAALASAVGLDPRRGAEPAALDGQEGSGERCCGTGHDDAGAHADAAAEAAGAALSGRVLDPAGVALASARVEVRAADGALRAVGQSGPDGAFRLEVAPGEVVVVARCTGWLEGWSRPLTLVAGDARDVGVLWLSEGVAVAGRVVDAHGRPIAGARVELDDERHVVTDDEGAFEATGLAPGAVTLVARAPGALPSDPLQLDLGAAGARGLSLQLRAQPVLRGLVRGPDGRPLAGASVARLCDLDAAVRTGADGRFALPGEREGEPLLVTAPGLSAARVDAGWRRPGDDAGWRRPGDDAGAEVTLRSVAPAPGTTARLTLRRGGAPAAGVTLLVAASGAADADADGAVSAAVEVVTSDADGAVWLLPGALDLALVDAATAHARLEVRSLAVTDAALTWELPATR